MSKKLLTLCMALAAFVALAVPAVASASPVMTDPTGAVKVGSKILGVQVGVSKFTSTEGVLQLECSNGEMTGEVVKNENNEIEGKITSATFWGTGGNQTGEPKPECTGGSSGAFGNATVTAVVSEKAPWCISSKGEDKFKVAGGACPNTTSTLKFKMVTTLAGTCEYESTGPIGGSYTTGGTATTLTVTEEHTTENGFKLISGNFLCPTSGKLDMKFTLQTDATSESIWIS